MPHAVSSPDHLEHPDYQSSVDSLLLTAPVVITQNAGREVLQDAGIVIKNGIIADVGPSDALQKQYPTARRKHLDNAVIMPGLVNAHCHASMTMLRGLADDLPLMQWLTRYIFPVEQHLTAEIVELGALLGCAEMTRTGTTAFADMYIYEEAVCRAVDRAGMKALAGEGLFMFPSAACPHFEDAVERTLRLHEQWSGNSRISIAVMPHSVYTTTPEILNRCRELMETTGLSLHIHAAETREETAESLRIHGLRPLAVCAEYGLLGPRTTVAHAVDLLDEEVTLLASTKSKVAHNPKSNMKLASGTARITDMAQAGVTVGLGTDGAASNNALNLFSDMKACALGQKAVTGNPASIPAQQALDMATIGSAAALHRPGTGSIHPGAEADLIALDLTAPNMQPMFHPVSHAVYAASGHEVIFTMVDGEILYEDGRFLKIDYPLLLEEVKKAVRWVRNRAE